MPFERDSLKSRFLSVDELQEWLRHELLNLDKEVNIRKEEATRFVGAYGRGELTPEEATDRYHLYQHRWFTPLDGHYAIKFDSDEALLAAIDRTRGRYVPLRELEQNRTRRSQKRENSGPETRGRD